MPYLSVKINLGNLYIFQSHKVFFFFKLQSVDLVSKHHNFHKLGTNPVHNKCAPLRLFPWCIVAFWHRANDCFLSKYGLSLHRHQRRPMGVEDMAGQISSLSKKLYSEVSNSRHQAMWEFSFRHRTRSRDNHKWALLCLTFIIRVVKSNQILNNRQNIDIILLHSNTCLVRGIYETPFNKIHNDKIKTLILLGSNKLNI